MPVFKVGSKLCYYAHVPKCAGTSVETYLTGRFGQMALLDQHYIKIPKAQRWSRTSPQHIDVTRLERMFPPGFFDASFAIVRHPIRRIHSAYLFQRDEHKTISPGMSFARWLKKQPAYWKDEPFKHDNHARPMADFVPQGAEVFKLEDGLDGVVHWLDTLADDTTGPREIARENAYRATPRRGLFGSPSSEITKADCTLIFDLYAVDFERFGYAVTIPNGVKAV